MGAVAARVQDAQRPVGGSRQAVGDAGRDGHRERVGVSSGHRGAGHGLTLAPS
jgi:hypothetical protein